MKLFFKFTAILIAVSFLTTSCSDDDSSASENQSILDSENLIFNFHLLIGDDVYIPDVENETFSLVFPANIDLSKVNTSFEISDKATVSPMPGVLQDFTEPVTYTVTAENGDVKKYIVNLTSSDARDGNSIVLFSFNDMNEPYSSFSTYEEQLVTIRVELPYLTPLTALTSNILISEGASIVPASGETIDYSSPVEYIVTAENGNKRKYLIVVDNNLKQVVMPPVSGNQFLDKKPGDLMTFSLNVLNPIKENNTINLIDQHKPNTKMKLVIENIDYETNAVTVRLPQAYLNSRYNLEIFVEDDNTDVSDSFRLDKGTPNFVHVAAFINEREDSVSYGSLLSPGESISATVFVDDTRFDQHNFYLRKGSSDVVLSGVTRVPNSNKINFTLPNLALQSITGGNDFQFVIEIDGIKTTYDFINDQSQTITIVVAETPIVTSLVTSAVKKGEKIILSGEHLYYSIPPNTRDVYYLNGSQLKLTATSGSKTYELESTDGSSGQIDFLVSDEIQTGTYNISYRNNIKSFGWLDTGLSVTITLPDSEHPAISATNGILYINSTSGLYLQVRVEFNQNIERVSVDRLLFAQNTIEIGNYFTATTSVLTGKLSNDQANSILANPDGKAVINDGGILYEVPFTVVTQN
ncbi:DUF5018 domain-containing protein [Aquimarina muelleri]|uniref:DUF5018 domain-containing protein n=1 Tax=Aquimarina muelleri TaxID=279356 RepID=UPI003F682302